LLSEDSKFKDSKFKDSRIQRFKDSRIQRFNFPLLISLMLKK